MKKLSILLLLLFAGSTFLLEKLQENPYQQKISNKKSFTNKDRVENVSVDKLSRYKINAELFPDQKKIIVEETITWRNNSSIPTDEIHFNLPLNAFKRSETIFNKSVKVPTESITGFDIESVDVDGEDNDLIYYSTDKSVSHDSTTAKIILNKVVAEGDSINIKFEYSFNIPKSFKRFGYAPGREFYFISEWYPKIAVYKNGEWHSSAYYPYTEFYNEYANYSAKIVVPKNFIADASAIQIDLEKINDRNEYSFVQNNSLGLCWFASSEIEQINSTFKSSNGNIVDIIIYYQAEREKYVERYTNAVKNSLNYLEKNIGTYPSSKIVLLDVPRTSRSAFQSYPNLITVGTNLISPIELLEPEKEISRLISEIYFKSSVSVNNANEEWLSKGVAEYLSTKILNEYYNSQEVYFKLINIVPIPGLILSSYNEIPIIYTLGNFELPEAFENISMITKHDFVGSLSEPTYTLPDKKSVYINTIAKPELMLLSLERYLGYDKMIFILQNYFYEFKDKHASASDFWNIIQKNTNEDLGWFIENVYKNDNRFDYKIRELIQTNDTTYSLFLERVGDGIFKTEIAVYTETDTSLINWNGKERWKIIEINSRDKIIAAEIDPHRKNIFDFNYANNSYTLETNHSAAISLSVRWFFWIQNALMVIGSIG